MSRQPLPWKNACEAEAIEGSIVTLGSHAPRSLPWHVQAANVHAILESGSAAAQVAERLDRATDLLDDFEQNLSIFDIKLRHMREDIAAIEARNNSLELQARNNSKLLAKLESALHLACGALQPSPGVSNLVRRLRCGSCMLQQELQSHPLCRKAV